MYIIIQLALKWKSVEMREKYYLHESVSTVKLKINGSCCNSTITTVKHGVIFRLFSASSSLNRYVQGNLR